MRVIMLRAEFCAKKPMRIVSFALAAACALAACGTVLDQTVSPAPNLRPTLVANRAKLFNAEKVIHDASIAKPSRFLNVGWQVCVRINSKNSSGGDAFPMTYTVVVYDNDILPILLEPAVDSDCIAAYYQPFPELMDTTHAE
jgi:hypothetical protein